MRRAAVTVIGFLILSRYAMKERAASCDARFPRISKTCFRLDFGFSDFCPSISEGDRSCGLVVLWSCGGIAALSSNLLIFHSLDAAFD